MRDNLSNMLGMKKFPKQEETEYITIQVDLKDLQYLAGKEKGSFFYSELYRFKDNECNRIDGSMKHRAFKLFNEPHDFGIKRPPHSPMFNKQENELELMRDLDVTKFNLFQSSYIYTKEYIPVLTSIDIMLKNPRYKLFTLIIKQVVLKENNIYRLRCNIITNQERTEPQCILRKDEIYINLKQ